MCVETALQQSETGKRNEVINEKMANFLEQHEVDV